MRIWRERQKEREGFRKISGKNYVCRLYSFQLPTTIMANDG